MGAYLVFNCTYLVSTATYCCKLSYKTIPTGTDHGDISLAGVWLHKEQFLCTSSIVMCLLISANVLESLLQIHVAVSPMALSQDVPTCRPMPWRTLPQPRSQPARSPLFRLSLGWRKPPRGLERHSSSAPVSTSMRSTLINTELHRTVICIACF